MWWQFAGEALGTFVGGSVGGMVGKGIGTYLDGDGSTKVTPEDAKIEMLCCVSGRFLDQTDGLKPETVARHSLTIAEVIEMDPPNPERLAAAIRRNAFRGDLFGQIVADVCGEPEVAKLLVLLLWRAAAADATISESEAAWIERFAEEVCLDRLCREECRSCYHRMPVDLTEPLSVLGLPPEASVGDARTRYKKRFGELHPDRQPPGSGGSHSDGSHSGGSQSDGSQQRAEAAAELKRIQEAYRSVHETDPTTFKGLNDESETLTEGEGSMIVRCLICSRRNRLPAPEHFATTRCGHCLALLLFPASTARQLLDDFMTNFGFPSDPAKRQAFLAVRDHLGPVVDGNLQVAPQIDPTRLQAAHAALGCDIDPGDVFAIYDDTFSGGFGDGFLLSHEAIAWSNSGEQIHIQAFDELEPLHSHKGGFLTAAKARFRCRGRELMVCCSMGPKNEIVRRLGTLVREMRGDAGSRSVSEPHQSTPQTSPTPPPRRRKLMETT